jgi:mannose-6-phosphate isomerase class I
MYEKTAKVVGEKKPMSTKRRVTTQPLMPQQVKTSGKVNDHYNLYPSHALETGKIFTGYPSLAKWIGNHRQVIIDGYSGVAWKEVQQCLQEALEQQGHTVQFTDMAELLKSPAAIQQLAEPFLGAPDSVWGTKCTHTLEDFFRMDQVIASKPKENYDINIAFGTGAALLSWEAPVIYLDVPKNEIQYRMRAGAITNLGCEQPGKPSDMYKRFYFVDWSVLNEHKKNIGNTITVIGDVQWEGTLSWMLGSDFQRGLEAISQNVFRVRPWFEAGAWGGQWMKEHIDLNADEVNYAWSFELIVPENGLVFESGGNLLEVSFDFLMFAASQSVLGKHAAVFGHEFPIRFDFLDTWEGSNLSIQCHPSLQYIREQFGENITQDETYYILDCKDDATVYLGFQEDIDPAQFRQALENSKQHNEEVDITQYVQCLSAQKHDLYLIPNGTVHSAGKSNLVLEISATPYIFTFKMYDWLRLDLNGEPRAINIEHAFNNLQFDRKGKQVQEKLISHPATIEKGSDWELIHLPTHAEHFYDVHRAEFDTRFTVQTNKVCHVLMLVEGTSVTVQMANGNTQTFQYAETFVIPAAAGEYTLINNGKGRAKVVKAFVKDEVNLPSAKSL